MALIALVNRVLPDPMLLHIVSSFHGDFRVEVKVLSLKRYWLAQNQELVRQHREKVEDILVWCMHRVGWFLHCLLYTSPSPRDGLLARMPSSA